ncbi:MAG: alpha-mannosidase [Bacteroidales bacterium]|nr:alpha-mannosidase [Bacteroidales bacterium]
MIRKLISLAAAFVLTASPAFTQTRWSFVDGFHGGVYGHYPIRTYTDFLSDQLEANPGWRICLEIEPETWDTVAVRTPEALKRFQALAATPRVEFTNPAYAQPYMYNVYGESIIRQLQYGMAKVWQYFPDAEFVTYAVEEPCFTSCLPGILGSLGFKYASLKCPNTCWGGYAAGFGNGNVRWIGPDGSELLTNPRYACEGLGDNVWETRSNGRYPDYLDACQAAGVERPVGMSYQDAGWTYGPWLGQEVPTDVDHSPYLTWREYFEAEPAGTPHEEYRMSQEDVRGGLVWGAQVLQRLSQQVRHAENKLLAAEKTAALLSLADDKLPDQARINEAWRTLMLSQHHDCWIVPYNRLNRRGSWADNVALWTAASEQGCDEVITALSATGDGTSFSIVNTAPFARKGMVRVEIPAGWPERFRIEDASGKGLPFFVEDGAAFVQVEAPALSVTPIRLCLSGRSTDVPVKAFGHGTAGAPISVSTDRYTLVFSPREGGVITSLRTRDGREYVDRNRGALGELKGWFPDEGRWHTSTESPATVTVSRAKGLRTKVTVHGRIANVPFTQVITLDEGSPRIDFDLQINWKKNVGIGKFAQKDAYQSRRRAFYDSRYDLNLLFPVSLDTPSLYKEAPFDVCESALEDTYFERWEDIKHNVILSWVDLCGKDGRSFALLSDHTTSYTYGPDHPLALTVQYSGNGLWGRDYRISGPTRVSYAIIPHEGRWDEARIQEENLSWNEPLSVLPGETAIGSFLDLAGSGYLVSALYVTADGCFLRLYNASGDESEQHLKLGVRARSMEEVNLLGQRTGLPDVSEEADGTFFSISIPRLGFKTLKITL